MLLYHLPLDLHLSSLGIWPVRIARHGTARHGPWEMATYVSPSLMMHVCMH